MGQKLSPFLKTGSVYIKWLEWKEHLYRHMLFTATWHCCSMHNIESVYVSWSREMEIIKTTVKPLIKDTPNKENLSIKDKSMRPNSYYTSTFLPPNKGNFSIKDKTPCPNVSFIRKFHCTSNST